MFSNRPFHRIRVPSLTMLALIGLALASLAPPTTTHAQTPFLSTQLDVGSGMSWGNGPADQTVSRRTPLFVDVSLRTWSDESPSLLWGGSLRMEIEGRASIAAVPRVEIAKKLGGLTVVPGIGVPFFFAPFSMLGVEVSTLVLLPLSEAFSINAGAMFDGYFFGSDVPKSSAVIMFNLMLGATLAL